MLSSLNSFGGLSAADLLKLFGANSSASSSSSTSTSNAQSASTGISASGANDPTATIKAILTQAQIGVSGGGSASIVTAEAAYATQTGGSGLTVSASVTVASPGVAKQIADAVSEVNTVVMTHTVVDPATNNGISGYEDAVNLNASDAVNLTIGSGGAVSVNAVGSAVQSGLPSLATIQQAISDLNYENTGSPASSAYEGNLTLVQLPANASGSLGGNFITFGYTTNSWGLASGGWALVLPQDSVSVAGSATQTTG